MCSICSRHLQEAKDEGMSFEEASASAIVVARMKAAQGQQVAAALWAHDQQVRIYAVYNQLLPEDFSEVTYGLLDAAKADGYPQDSDLIKTLNFYAQRFVPGQVLVPDENEDFGLGLQRNGH